MPTWRVWHTRIKMLISHMARSHKAASRFSYTLCVSPRTAFSYLWPSTWAHRELYRFLPSVIPFRDPGCISPSFEIVRLYRSLIDCTGTSNIPLINVPSPNGSYKISSPGRTWASSQSGLTLSSPVSLRMVKRNPGQAAKNFFADTKSPATLVTILESGKNLRNLQSAG